MRNVRAAMALGAVVLAAGCGGGGSEQGPLSWGEFRALAYQEAETGVFITNGDELAETEDDLRAAYARYLGELDAEPGVSTGPLIVNLVNGQDDKWSSPTATSLTYCVSQRDFGARYGAVVSAMDAASAAWEATANVNFVHDASQDGNCTARNASVVFDVRQVNDRPVPGPRVLPEHVAPRAARC